MMGFESDFQNTYATNRYHFGVDDANDNDIDDPNKKSRTALVTCACSFCKKRHLKCDGQLPCSNCVAKKIGDQCCYPQQAKRGRKPVSPQSVAATQLTPYKYSNSYKNTPEPQPEQNSRDANLLIELMKYRQEAEFWKQQYFREHEKCISLQIQSNAPKVVESSIQLMQLSASIFFRSAANKLGSILPFYVSIVDSDFPWHNYQGIRCDGYRTGMVAGEELCNALEYASICALGSLEHNLQTSIEFANKAEDLLYILFWKELIHKNEKLAYRAFKVVLMFTTYWWCNLNPMKAQLVSHLALLMWNCQRTLFPTIWCFQMFGILATCSKTYEERVRWLGSMKATMDQMSEPAENLTCLQIAFATSLSFVRPSPSSQGAEKQTYLLFSELLSSGKWFPSERSRLILGACKAVVFSCLGNYETALEHCHEVMRLFDPDKIDLPVLLSLASVMKVLKSITKEDVSETQKELLKKYQQQYPVLRDLINTMYGLPPEFMKHIVMQIPSEHQPPVTPLPIDNCFDVCEPADPRVTSASDSSSSTPESLSPEYTSYSSFETESPPSIQEWQFLIAALNQPGFNPPN